MIARVRQLAGKPIRGAAGRVARAVRARAARRVDAARARRAARASSAPGSRPCARYEPAHRERVWPLLARRASFALYRRSPRYAALAGREHARPVAVPAFTELAALALLQHTPAPLARWAGVERTLRAAELLRRAAGRTLGALRWLARLTRAPRAALAHRREARAAARRTRADAAAVTQPRAHERNVGLVLDGAVALDAAHLTPDDLTLFFRPLRPFRPLCQVFVHLFPEHASQLPPERVPHGYIALDHWPALETSRWPVQTVVRDRTSLVGVPHGFYRVRVGLVEVSPFRLLRVDQTGQTSIDLGWVRVGPAPAPPALATPEIVAEPKPSASEQTSPAPAASADSAPREEALA